MKDAIQECRDNIARLSGWRGWFNLNRKNELAHYKNMLAILQRAETMCNILARMKDPVLQRKGGRRA